MTRDQLQRLYPDTYAFFKDVKDQHPFWKAVWEIDWNDARDGKTLLPDLERVFSSLHLVDGHHVLKDQLEDLVDQDDLMDMLTRLYVAYLYRKHGSRLVKAEHGYDLEIEIADQLLAMGVVKLRSFRSLQEQFDKAIEDEETHLESMTDQDGREEESTEEFMAHLREHARTLREHPEADHQVLAAISNHADIDKQTALTQKIAGSKEELRRDFPHIAGVVLVDPAHGREKVRYVPFHGHEGELEQLLERNG